MGAFCDMKGKPKKRNWKEKQQPTPVVGDSADMGRCSGLCTTPPTPSCIRFCPSRLDVKAEEGPDGKAGKGMGTANMSEKN